jgi:hypothetical protein
MQLVGAAATLLYDAFVGVPFVAAIGETNDYGEARRRTYYGQAGSHRVKPYGVEYRVLSGMLLSSPFMLTWVLGQVRMTSQKLYQGLKGFAGMKEESMRSQIHDWVGDQFHKYNFEDCRKIINSHDVAAARDHVKQFKSSLYAPKFINAMIEADKKNIGINMNIAEAWAIDRKIYDHSYPGVEGLMSPYRVVETEQFPPSRFIKKSEGAW